MNSQFEKRSNWCLTYFAKEDYEQFEHEHEFIETCQIYELYTWWDERIKKTFVRAVGQIERCPESGRLHLQAYGELSGGLTLSALKRKLGDRVHLEPRRSARHIAIRYCIKDDTWVPPTARLWHPNQEEFGPIRSEQGKRSDLHDFCEAVETNGLTQAIMSYPETFVKFHRGFERYSYHLRRVSANRDQPKEVFVLWGAPGTGKTRFVYDKYGYENVFRLHLGGTEWWDGYYGQPILIMDDFYGQVPLSRMLHILDRYPQQLPTKGGFTFPNFAVIYITSNVPWEEWYEQAFIRQPALKVAFRRRIKEITHFIDPNLGMNTE